jgi:hypothetical protein
MRRVLLAAILGGLASSACAAGTDTAYNGSFPTEAFTTVTSESAALSVEVRTAPAQPPTRGLLEVEYRVAEVGGTPVAGLDLQVVPWMPEMGHGTSTTPQVTDAGGGRYVISNVELFMAGRWDLRTTVRGPRQDSVTPTFQIP